MVRYDRTLRGYYDKRAQEHEKVYTKRDPVWRKELEVIAAAMTEALRGRRVLEIACGTGFWTEIVGRVANHVIAIDVSEEMLEIAKKRSGCSNVEYRRGDAYALDSVPSKFNAGAG